MYETCGLPQTSLFMRQWLDGVDSITSFASAALYTFAHPFVFPKSRWELSV